MQRENNTVMTGIFKTDQITSTFEKQSIVFASKNRDGNWQDGDFECYVKPDLMQQSGLQNGDLVKASGFLVFNFFTKQDGTVMTFPKFIVSEIKEIEKAGAGQQQAQAAPQPAMNTGAPMTPPQPGGAPMAPPMPGAPQPVEQAFAAPVPPAPVPPAPVPPAA